MSRDKGAKVHKERKKEIEEAKKEEKPVERYGQPNDVPVKEPL